MPPTANPRVAAALAGFCCLLWGSAYPAIKTGYALFGIGTADVPSKLLFAGIRFAAAGAIVLAIALASGRSLALRGRTDALRVLALGLVQTALQYAFFYVGVANTSGSKASVVNSTSTFFSALLAHFLYTDDRLNRRKALGCLVGFAGVVAVNWSGDLLFDWKLEGEGFVVLAGLVISAASLWGRHLSQRIDPMVLTGWQLLAGGTALTALGAAAGGSFGPVGLAGFLDLAYLAVLSSVAFTVWTMLLRDNKVTSVTVYQFLVPVSGVALSALALGEGVLEWRYLAALAAVSAGIVLVNAGGRWPMAGKEPRAVASLRKPPS